MKKRIIFYSAVIIPLVIIIVLINNKAFAQEILLLMLFIYAFIYQPMIFGIRLIEVGEIDKADFKKSFNPFWTLTKVRALFLS